MLIASLRKVFILTTSGKQSSNNGEHITQRDVNPFYLNILNLTQLFCQHDFSAFHVFLLIFISRTNTFLNSFKSFCFEAK